MTKQIVCNRVVKIISYLIIFTVLANGMMSHSDNKVYAASYKVETIQSKKQVGKSHKIYSTPSKNSFKSYMPYKAITDKSSPQYKLQKKAHTGKYGIRMVGDRYCIALGSYYTTKIGKKVDLIMKNGSVIECILADQKANRDTDSKKQKAADGSIVEFIVDTPSLHKKAKRMGDISYCSKDFSGEIKQVKIYK